MHEVLSREAIVNLDQLRRAQRGWHKTGISSRLRIVRRLRDLIARNAERLTHLFPRSLARTAIDSLTSEILPLADACRFLELEATRILRTERASSRGRPLWFRKVAIEVHHEPVGLVLVLGPANYPLFLAAVQTLQALVAGNAVLLKPGSGARGVLTAFAELLFEAGFPEEVLTVLDEEVESGITAIEGGVDKIILTGSVESGRAVLRRAAEHITSTTLELSGDDPVFVLASADLERAARAINFGVHLNGGETCIAPRRAFVHVSVIDQFRACLGANVPIEITPVSTDDEALALAEGPYALGASIFGDEQAAATLARRVSAGVVVINDLIAPTADPRVSFGGHRWSGFGKTRGEEGLREMTNSKVVVVQRGKRLRHLETLPTNADELFLAYLVATHSFSWKQRLAGWREVVRAAMKKEKAC